MRTFLGMILGALLLIAGVYVHDSMATSTVGDPSEGATCLRYRRKRVG